MILSSEEIRIIKEGMSHSSQIVQLCESYEQLRAERDEIAKKYKRLLDEIVEKTTVREKRYGQ